MNTQLETREVQQVVNGLASSDGDGVQLTRIIGSPALPLLDPFLLFDAFGSDKPQDYIGGFPNHPHRGFETVTYMLAGNMRHKDSVGNNGVISAGDVQWMTAGSGIIHSEMPEQENGLLAGFQLWVNLPKSHKMCKPKYQEYNHNEIPVEQRTDKEAATVKLISGTTKNNGSGIVTSEHVKPIYWDINLANLAMFNDFIPQHYNAFVYVIDGEVSIGTKNEIVKTKQLAVLTKGEQVNITNKINSTVRFLLIAGKPLNESIERGGPFVMNTKQEIYQAFADYQAGNLVR